MLEIIPAILTNDPKELEQLTSKAEDVVSRIQIDIVDGQFAKNETIDPSVLENIDTNLKLDFHLMTKNPTAWVERCIRGMADRIFGQIEMMDDQVEFVGKVQEVGAKIGLAIDIDTPISDLDSAILNNLDAVLLISYSAGIGGQPFDPKVLDKIKRLDAIRVHDKKLFKICVDGGITEKTIRQVRRAGANEVAVGRIIFEGDLKENLVRFKEAAYK
jgi:ribulose-phosphate 3-epimerase